jgi:chromosome segregation ATPase
MEKRRGGGAGRLALILAVLALFFAWSSYRRQGGELKTLWRDLTGGAGGRVQVTGGEDLRALLNNARARLEERRAEVAAERNLQDIRDEVAEIRDKLAEAYREGSTDTRERLRTLDGELERLQGQLREGGSKALTAFDSAMERIQRTAAEEQ